MELMDEFAPRLIAWQKQHGRHDLPWQRNLHPYPVWLSEIMLQQTQVSTVQSYFARFLYRFPTVVALAGASLDEVLSLWSGLGYYSRARNLHRCAQQVVALHGGQFPSSAEALQTLPGIGPSTAAAIASLCFLQPISIMDGNVRRVLTRLLAFEHDMSSIASQKALNHHAQSLVPQGQWVPHMASYTQGLMDLGATLCTTRGPRCSDCPVQSLCAGRAMGDPTRFPIKTRKTKRTSQVLWMLWLHTSRDHLWLTRRPNQGIWAALFCLPVFATQTQLLQVLSAKQAQKAVYQQPFVHVLTHRDLHIHPVRVQVAKSFKLPEGGWHSAVDWPSLGLPAPVRRLLSG